MVSFVFGYINLSVDAFKQSEDIGNTWRFIIPKDVSFEIPIEGSITFVCYFAIRKVVRIDNL